MSSIGPLIGLLICVACFGLSMFMIGRNSGIRETERRWSEAVERKHAALERGQQ